MITGNFLLALTFGVVCAGQTLLTAWLVERWFGRAFKLEDVPQVLGFLVASAVGAASRQSAPSLLSVSSIRQHPL